MNALTEQLARSLASAVNAESAEFEAWKGVGRLYPLPGWFQPAVEALAEYEREREQQMLDKNRIY